MSHGSYRCRALVVRKTKLGESDTIVTMLQQDGSLIRVVAHGARKPKNPFSTRLDLFSVCDLLVSRGRNLDIVSEARLIQAFDGIKRDAMRVAALEPVLEAVGKTAQEGLAVPRLFDMTVSVLQHGNDADADVSPVLCAAYLLKLCAVMGVSPSFNVCVTCGKDVPLGGAHLGGDERNDEGVQRFSMSGGGIVCDSCMLSEPTTAVPTQTLAWSNALLRMTFDQVVESPCNVDRAFGILRFCQQWMQTNLSIRLKSLDFLFNAGML